MKLLAILLLVSTLASQDTWHKSTASPPPHRYRGAVAYDSARGVVVLFGGQDKQGLLRDTWEWDGVAWSLRSTSGPLARYRHAMAYDSVRKVTVLFGGLNHQSTRFRDTWEWDGTSWVLRHQVGAEEGRYDFPMAFDAARGQVIRFGGGGSGGMKGDTLAWNGTTWTTVSLGGPSARYDAAMVYDAWRSRLVLFGGYEWSSTFLNDTWEWDGTTWTPRFPQTKPPIRAAHGMAWCGSTGLCILYGGYAASTYYTDTWVWDGTSWQQRTVNGNPGTQQAPGVAYDALRNRVVMLTMDLSTDTWLYTHTPKAAASFAAYGKGCGGATLRGEGGQLPWVGIPFTMRLDSLPVSSVTVLLGYLGASSSQWGPFQLPLDLTVFGMPGCSLLASGEILFGHFAVNGTAAWTVAIPADRAVIGLRFYSQWMAVDLTRLPRVFVWTNGGAGQVGER